MSRQSLLPDVFIPTIMYIVLPQTTEAWPSIAYYFFLMVVAGGLLWVQPRVRAAIREYERPKAQRSQRLLWLHCLANLVLFAVGVWLRMWPATLFHAMMAVMYIYNASLVSDRLGALTQE